MADIIVNMESSHCYPDIHGFFKSVCYLLKDDGIFIISDFRFQHEMEGFEKDLESYFDVIKKEDVRRNVFHAMQLQNSIKMKALKEKIPWYMQKFMQNFFAVENSRMYNELQSGERAYFAYALKKKKAHK